MAHRKHDTSGEHSVDAVALVDGILAQAVRRGASDVHFEPTPEGMLVRFRLDGMLRETDRLPAEVAENIVARLKVLAGLLTYRTNVPQEGRIPKSDAGAERLLDQRLAVFPTIHGQRAVVRLFYDEPELCDLHRLGLPPGALEPMQQIAQETQGMLLLTGPAGSGKSTTLAAMLREIRAVRPGRSIVALEDPVERRIEGVTQVQIPPAGEMTFAVALRSLLRQDPEVLMIGEIRDAETARIAAEAALTGHLLLSTMHAGSPAGALLRLLEMGVEPYQITSSVMGVVNQRLLRRVCAACAGAGCDACAGAGYRGRALAAEIVPMDGELRAAVLARADRETLEEILTARGHMSLRCDAMRLVGDGTTDRAEVDRVCGPRENGAT